MMNNVVVFTVIYPSAICYINDFVACLDNQTFKQFDVLIVNDGCDEDLIKKSFINYNTVLISKSLTPAKNREIGYKTAYSLGYKYLFFCDIDDWFHDDRLQLCMKYLIDYDIVVNNINITDVDRNLICESYFSNSIKNNTIIDKNYISNKNLLGLSNTAIKLQASLLIDIPKDLKIFDWYFYTICLEKGFKAIYCDISLTDYRQHSNNLIGIGNYSVELFKKLIHLKVEHYRYLIKIYPHYLNLLIDTNKLSSLNDEQLEEIINENNKIKNHPLWWENITLIYE